MILSTRRQRLTLTAADCQMLLRGPVVATHIDGRPTLHIRVADSTTETRRVADAD